MAEKLNAAVIEKMIPNFKKNFKKEKYSWTVLRNVVVKFRISERKIQYFNWYRRNERIEGRILINAIPRHVHEEVRRLVFETWFSPFHFHGCAANEGTNAARATPRWAGVKLPPRCGWQERWERKVERRERTGARKNIQTRDRDETTKKKTKKTSSYFSRSAGDEPTTFSKRLFSAHSKVEGFLGERYQEESRPIR